MFNIFVDNRIVKIFNPYIAPLRFDFVKKNYQLCDLSGLARVVVVFVTFSLSLNVQCQAQNTQNFNIR